MQRVRLRPRAKYFKLLQPGWTHFGFQYREGLNELGHPMRSALDGLFFCAFDDLLRWLAVFDDAETICEVELCENSTVVWFRDKLKTDRLILRNPTPVGVFIRRHFNLFHVLEANPFLIRHVEAQNDLLCMYATDRHPHALRHCTSRGYGVCEQAVAANGLTIQYLDWPSESLSLMAAKQNGLSLCAMPRPPPEVCLEAVRQNGLALQCSPHQTQEICEAAVRQNGYAIRYVKEPNLWLAELAVQQNRHVMNWLPASLRTALQELRASRRKIEMADDVIEGTVPSRQP